MKIKYYKSAIALPQQVDLLKSKNLILTDVNFCYDFLSRVSYHRMYPYFLPFLIDRGQDANFLNNARFESVVALYEFDKNLRVLINDALEVFEIAFRTAISNSMSLRHGPFWFLDSKLFQKEIQHKKFIELVDELCQRADEYAIKQYFKKYNEPYPPSWLLLENLTFGTCSKLFNNIQSVRDKKEICNIFSQHPTVIGSWAKALVYMRNLCAHHARVWNRWFVIQPIAPNKGNIRYNSRSIYMHLLVLSKLMETLLKNNNWKEQVHSLFSQSEFVNFEEMGFNKDWRNDEFFRSVFSD